MRLTKRSGAYLTQLSVQAHIGVADVKPHCGGQSQKMGKIFEKYGM